MRSGLDRFRAAEEQVVKRLRELKPVVAEYQELEQVAQRLSLRFDEDETAWCDLLLFAHRKGEAIAGRWARLRLTIGVREDLSPLHARMEGLVPMVERYYDQPGRSR